VKNFSLKREPAFLWIGLLAPTVQAVSAFVLDANPDIQGAVNAAAVAVAGGLTAFLVRSEKQVPAITAALQALIALGVAFGLHATAEQQATLMVPLGMVVSLLVRDRVYAAPPAIDD
jgi:hypothetical protein